MQKQLRTKKHSRLFIAIAKSAYWKNKLINTGIYFVFLMVMLLVNYFAILGFKGNIWILLDLLLIIFSVSPIFFFRRTMFDRIYLPILMFFVMAFFTININFYRFFGTVFALKDIRMAIDNFGQAGVNINGLNWVVTAFNIIWFALALTGTLLFNIKYNWKDNNKQDKNPTKRRRVILASSLMGASLLTYEFTMGMWVIGEKSKQIDSIKYVNYNANYHFKNLGMVSYYVREIRQFMTDRGVSDANIIKYLNQATLVDDDYTGILTRPNVFAIMIETGDKTIINPYTMPNLCALLSNGINGAHNYSVNHTNVSNMIGVTGNYTSSMLNQHKTYEMPFSLANILKDEGYNTRFYYDCDKSQDGYRDLDFIPTMGFDNCFWHDDLLPGVKPWTYPEQDFIPDTIVANKILDNLKSYIPAAEAASQPFYAQWMTMFMHVNYIIKDSNKAIMDELKTRFGTKLKTFEQEGKWVNPCTDAEAKQKYEIYTLKCMDFDQALGELLKYFYVDGSDYLKNTIFVVFGDHMNYENIRGTPLYKIIRNVYDEQNINAYSTILGFYHPTLNALVDGDTTGLFSGHSLKRTTSPACIAPTILDLMGIAYNSNLYQDKSIFDLDGQDKFDKSMNQIYFSSWKKLYMTENYSSDNGATISRIIKDNSTQDEFKEKVRAKQYQLRVLDSIYKRNFFNHYKYKDFIPKTKVKFQSNEVALVKEYE